MCEFIGRSIRWRSVKLSWENGWFQLLMFSDMSWAAPIPASKISWKQIIYKNTKMSLNIPQIFSSMSELIWFMLQWKVALIFIWTVSSHSLRLTFSHNGLDYEKKKLFAEWIAEPTQCLKSEWEPILEANWVFSHENDYMQLLDSWWCHLGAQASHEQWWGICS